MHSVCVCVCVVACFNIISQKKRGNKYHMIALSLSLSLSLLSLSFVVRYIIMYI